MFNQHSAIGRSLVLYFQQKLVSFLASATESHFNLSRRIWDASLFQLAVTLCATSKACSKGERAMGAAKRNENKMNSLLKPPVAAASEFSSSRDPSSSSTTRSGRGPLHFRTAVRMLAPVIWSRVAARKKVYINLLMESVICANIKL